MKKQLPLLAVLLAGFPMFAQAEDSPSPHSLTGNVSLTSNYVFRGISQTGGKPAIQGGFDYTHASGLYLGTWGSNVGWVEDFQGYSRGSMEMDIYGGYRNSIGDVSYDVGGIRYMYPGGLNNSGLPGVYTSELYGSLGWKWFTVKYSHYVSDSVFGVGPNTNGTYYLDLSGSLPVGDTGLTLGAHWGTFQFKHDSSFAVSPSYDDWKVNASYDLSKLGSLGSGMTLGLMYTDTNAKKGFWTDLNNEYLGKGTTTVSISKAL